MGNFGSSPYIPEETMKQIHAETGFTVTQIETLWHRFTVLDKNDKGYLTREDFLGIPELAINPLADRIVHAFFQDGHDGHETEYKFQEKMQFFDFVKVLAHFRPIKKEKEHSHRNKLNSRRDKLKFAFRMYDLDSDNQISKEEVLAVLTMMVGTDDNISEEQLRNIAEQTIKECGHNDRLIDFDEFCEAMEKIDVETKMAIRLK
jgi:calcineurin B family protein 1